MDKPTFKLVGSPCGQHGQYTFYKALRVIGPGDKERIIAIGDFFYVRIWQDSELVSIGELQLLWTDRVSDQTLVSLRLYFLPENTPSGRNGHGEDEVVALNEKVVLRADDLLTWLCTGSSFRTGLRAVWKGACSVSSSPPAPTDPLHQTKLDFSDVEKEKSALEADPETPAVVVFSYPRYCRYRALIARLEGLANEWLRDSLVAALGGYAGDTKNTAITYCKETFEYPDLEGHEFVCNHLAPRLKGRPRGRRRRIHRSRSHSPDERSSDSDGRTEPVKEPKISSRRLSLRNGASDKQSSEEEETRPSKDRTNREEQRFVRQLQRFYIERGEDVDVASLNRELSLHSLYSRVMSCGGFEAVSGRQLWRPLSQHTPGQARGLYHRYLLPFENHERRLGKLRSNGKLNLIDTIHVLDSPRQTPSPKPENLKLDKDEIENVISKPAEELNREFLESLPKEDKPLISVKPVEKLIDPDKHKQNVMKVFSENSSLVAELTAKYKVSDSKVIEEVAEKRLSDPSSMMLNELATRLGTTDTAFLKELSRSQTDLASNALSSLSSLVNGHTPNGGEQTSRPLGRSSLRAVRVKPARPALSAAANHTTPTLRPGSASSSPPSLPSTTTTTTTRTNFGIQRTTTHNNNSDDEIVEVPYKPKTPEIIDLDEYPESPQSAKKKKLDILKERGLEVTAIPAWGAVPNVPIINPQPLMLNPAMQHQIMTQASLFQMYNIIPQNYANGIQPPKVIQATCIYGSSGPEKTVYGNPKDPFMPPPHILHGTPVKPQRTVTSDKPEHVVRQDILDLTCKSVSKPKPAVEIVRIPSVPSPSKSNPQNLSKNYTLIDGKAVVGSNLEITLVNPKCSTPPKNRPPQKRSSNGKFVSTKTPTPPKDYPKDYKDFPKDYKDFSKDYKDYPKDYQDYSKDYKDYPKNYPSPSGAKTVSPTIKKPPIVIPNYQINRDDVSPTSSTGSKDSQQSMLQNVYRSQSNMSQLMDLQKGHLGPQLDMKSPNLAQIMDLQMQKSVPTSPFIDPVYMSALYSTLAGQMDQRQLAMYRDLMASQFRYSNLLGPPTTKS